MQPVDFANLALSISMMMLLNTFVRKSAYPFYAPSNLFLVFYWIVVPGGVILALMYELFIGEFKSSSSEIFTVLLIAWLGLLFYYIGMWSGNIVYGRLAFTIFPSTQSKTKRLIAVLMLIVSLSVMIIYASSVSLQGVESGNDYSERFSNNLGKGYLTLFFYYYIPAILLLFMLKPTRQSWFFFFALVVLIGIFNFVAIGGARRGIFIGIVVMLLVGHIFGIVRLTIAKVVFGGILMVAGLTTLASVRYGVILSDFTKFEYYQVVHWIIDSISPIDSLVNANRYISETRAFQGVDLFLNQFQAIIPRSLWPGKPDLILNSGNFYTQEVLNYPVEGLTISPTLLGAFTLAGGLSGVAVGMMATGFLMNWLSLALINSNDYLSRVFIISNAISFFGLAREGIEVLVYKLILDYILFLTFIFAALFISQFVLRKKESALIKLSF